MSGRWRARTKAVVAAGLGHKPPLAQPWDYIQWLVEQRFHEYLGVDSDEIGQIVIVGAYHGHEIARMLPRYRNASFVCLEPNPADFNALADRYQAEQRVTPLLVAAAEASGRATFNLTSRRGTGSLLKPMDPHNRVRPLTKIVVSTVTLDSLSELAPKVDCLWLDVQGAEGRVLDGAVETLARTASVFCEVSTRIPAYENGTLMPEIANTLSSSGFDLVALGIDPVTGEGNSFWVRR